MKLTENKTREELIELYYDYSPRDIVDMIDLDKERERINTMPLDELKSEVEFYIYTSNWD